MRDSNLYLRRRDERLLLSIEHRHRANPSQSRLPLARRGSGDALALAIVKASPSFTRPPSLIDKLEHVLRSGVNYFCWAADSIVAAHERHHGRVVD